ncbi:MAG: ion channel [Pseudomonadota bacterium]
MSLVTQIIFGSCMLTACALIHVALVAVAVPYFSSLGHAIKRRRALLRNTVLLSFGVMVTVFAHTVQIWGWAFALYWLRAFGDFGTAFYFTIATYTTLGYGDLLLGPELRIFASFASITGLLTFGISTAMLIGLVTRLLDIDNNRVTRND